MIGKIIGAIAGKNAAKHIRGVDGPGGALLGVGAAAVLRRLGPLGLVAAALGGYAVKRYVHKRETRPASKAGNPPD